MTDKEIQEGQNPDCSQHPKDLFGHTDMKEVAEAIGNLHYETQCYLFDLLRHKYHHDAIKDAGGGRYDLAGALENASTSCGSLFIDLEDAWEISKPFMKQQ